jgi:DNA-binding SARP family transcriptional activator
MPADPSAPGQAGSPQVRLLGPVELAAPSGPLPLAGPAQRTLVAVLAVHAGRPVPPYRLVEALYGDRVPPTAAKTLHSHIAHLRRAWRPAGQSGLLVTWQPGYALTLPPEAVDAHRLELGLARARRALAAGDAGQAGPLLRRALALWRGEPFADCRPGAVLQAEAARLGELRFAALADLMSVLIELGQHAAAVAELEFLVARHPLRERFWELLVLALSRADRPGQALAACRRARAVLAEQLGVEPGPGLRSLEAAVHGL